MNTEPSTLPLESRARTALWFVTAVFAGLALQLLTVPAEALSQHGIDIYGQPPSAFAEIRAYYAGTLTVCALRFHRGAKATATPAETLDALATFATLMGLFVAVRCVSYVVDGPPTITYAYFMWAGELVGCVAATFMHSYAAGRAAAHKAD